jgi:hypothetical protein
MRFDNYPPGVSQNTWGAPWNDEEIDLGEEFVLAMYGTLLIPGPTSNENKQEAKYKELQNLKEEIVKVLNNHFDYEFEIK